MQTIRKRSAFLLAALALLTTAGCTRSIRVIVDNGDDVQPIQISINGVDKGTVQPGQQLTISIEEPGEAVFTVRRGGEVFRTEAHMLEFQSGGLSTRTYLFNPDRSRHYFKCSVQYGESMFGALANSLIEKNTTKEQQIRHAFTELQGQFAPLECSGWNDISNTSYLFSDLPDTMTSKSSSVRVRSVQLTTPELHARLTAAFQKQKPTEDDYDALSDVASEIYDTLQFK